MGILFLGIIALVSFMLVVMGIPLVYYIKRDARWMESDQSVQSWYNL